MALQPRTCQEAIDAILFAFIGFTFSQQAALSSTPIQTTFNPVGHQLNPIEIHFRRHQLVLMLVRIGNKQHFKYFRLADFELENEPDDYSIEELKQVNTCCYRSRHLMPVDDVLELCLPTLNDEES